MVQNVIRLWLRSSFRHSVTVAFFKAPIRAALPINVNNVFAEGS